MAGRPLRRARMQANGMFDFEGFDPSARYACMSGYVSFTKDYISVRPHYSVTFGDKYTIRHSIRRDMDEGMIPLAIKKVPEPMVSRTEFEDELWEEAYLLSKALGSIPSDGSVGRRAQPIFLHRLSGEMLAMSLLAYLEAVGVKLN